MVSYVLFFGHIYLPGTWHNLAQDKGHSPVNGLPQNKSVQLNVVNKIDVRHTVLDPEQDDMFDHPPVTS